MFGTKEYASRINFLNDSIPYKSSNAADSTRFGGVFFNAGIQYKIQLNEKVTLRLGAHGNLQTTMRAKRNITRQTADFSTNTGLIEIDSIYTGQDESGTIIHPSTWGVGFVIHHETQWLFGGEINFGNWSDYRYYGATDNMVNNWTARLGAQILPNYKADSYFSRMAYRVGASFGTDNVKLNNTIPQYSFTFGLGLPVRRNVYTNQYTTINTAFEIGFRGNRQNDIRESLFRVSLGLNLSDIWFNKPKYQ
jgi:long-subunit fatty acid transport protein